MLGALLDRRREEDRAGVTNCWASPESYEPGPGMSRTKFRSAMRTDPERAHAEGLLREALRSWSTRGTSGLGGPLMEAPGSGRDSDSRCLFSSYLPA